MLTGIILAGGKSSRMGTDKCFLEINNVSFFQNTISIFEKISDKILISANSDKFNFLKYPVVKDEVTDCGPIGGIYSTLKKSTTNVNFFAPCDLPFLKIELYTYLLSLLADFDAVVPVFKEKVEPLTIVLRRNTLGILEKQIRNNQYKILSFLQKISTNFIEINKDLPFYSENLFKNINKPDDLKDYLDMFKS